MNPKYKALGLCCDCGDPQLFTKTRCKTCRNKHHKSAHAHRQRSIKNGMCRVCLVVKRELTSTMCESCRVHQNEKEKARNQMWRHACIVAYGGKCGCCGITNKKYLQLDHINNDGASHRRDIKYRNMYCWAFNQHFPPILQLLCANCHQAKTRGETCTEEDHQSTSSRSSSQ